MTGHWQILGSARVPLQEMVGIDYRYVANWSLWTDLEIMLRTVPYMLARRGVRPATRAYFRPFRVHRLWDGGASPDIPNRQPMLLLLTALLVVWIVVALAAIALVVYASRADEAIDSGELAPVIQLRSAA